MIKRISCSYKMAWQLTKSARKHLMLLLIIITVFKIEVPLVIPYIIRWIFEAVESNNLHFLFIAAGKGLVIFSLNIVLMYFINVYGDAWAMKLAFCAAENSFKTISDISVGDIKRSYSNADLFNRIASGTGQIVGLWFATIDIFSALVAAVIITAFFAIQSGIVVQLALLLILADVLRGVIMYVYVNRKTREIEKKRTFRLEYLKSIVSSHTFHMINGTEKTILDKYKFYREKYLKANEEKINFVAVCDAISEVVHNIFIALLGHSYFELRQSNRVSIGQVNSSYNLFSSLKDTVNSLVQATLGISGKFVPIERLNNILPPHTERKNDRNFMNLISGSPISYRIRDKEILKNISLHIEKGESVAIIGDNGSGKSTILKCLSGVLTDNGVVSRNFGEHIAYMPAELYLFNSQTGYTNICMGKDISMDSAKEKLEQLLVVNSEEIMQRVCSNFSGGEKQRIAIVRSIVADKDVILWDEPTSALDEKSIERIKKIIGNCKKTLIFVTHLPELAKVADKIYIIKDGEVIDHFKSEDAEENIHFKKWLAYRKENI